MRKEEFTEPTIKENPVLQWHSSDLFKKTLKKENKWTKMKVLLEMIKNIWTIFKLSLWTLFLFSFVTENVT